MATCDFCRNRAVWRWARYALCQMHLDEWLDKGRIVKGWGRPIERLH